VDAAELAAGTKVQVETVNGCFRGTLIKSLKRDSDVELHCLGHDIRLDRRCIRRVRVLIGGTLRR
jgi:hypothetical protein